MIRIVNKFKKQKQFLFSQIPQSDVQLFQVLSYKHQYNGIQLLLLISLFSLNMRIDEQQNKGKRENIRKKIQHYSFNVYDVIGKGYSSYVYQAINLNNSLIFLTDQIVAIKTISMNKLKTQIHKQLLLNEIQSLKILNHQNIIRCYDVFTTANNTYIIFQLCQQGDFDNYLRQFGPLQQNRAIDFLLQIAKGMQEFFNKKIIHRDLKPTNFLMKNGKIKIGDLGFSKKVHDPQRLRCNVGTPLYMPPQSILEHRYSHKSDIWALGVIAYEMVQGMTPFYSSSEKQLIDKLLNCKYNFHSNKISNEYKEFVSKCLIVNQNQRLSEQQLLICVNKLSFLRDSRQIMNQPKFKIPQISSNNCIKQKQKQKELIYNSGTLMNNLQKRFGQQNCFFRMDIYKQTDRGLSRPSIFRKNRFFDFDNIVEYQKTLSKNKKQSEIPEWAYPRYKSISLAKQNNNKINKQTEKQQFFSQQKLISKLESKHKFENLGQIEEVIKKKNKQKKFCMIINSKILISHINYCRCLFKMLILIENFSMIINSVFKQRALSMLYCSLMYQMNNLKKAIIDKQNVYNQQFWSQFCNNNKMDKFEFVFNTYNNRYNKYLSQNGYKLKNSKILQSKRHDELGHKISKNFILETRRIIKVEIQKVNKTDQLPQYIQKMVLGLDYMISLYQMITIRKEHNDPIYFAINSKIEQIANGFPVKKIKKIHFQKIEQKLLKLNIH